MKIWSFLIVFAVLTMGLSQSAHAYDRSHRSSGISAGVGNLVRVGVGGGRGIHANVGNIVKTEVSGRGVHAGVGDLVRVGVGGGSRRGYRDDDRYSDRHDRYRRCDDNRRQARYDRYDREDRYYDDSDRDYRDDGGDYRQGGSLIGDILGGVLGY